MQMNDDDVLFQALASPGMAVSGLSRDQWIMVGMALKSGGYPVSVWDDWSRNDSRYKQGECEKKWKGFSGSAGGRSVTVASIIKLAEENGWTYRKYDISNGIIGWDDEIEWDGEVFSGFQEKSEVSPANDLKLYIQTLFKSDEIIGYVTNDVWKDSDGKWKPSKGSYTKTAGEILELIDKYPDDIEFAIGSWEKEAGAWIRFNPLNGDGVKNVNVTRFTYALVESDTLPLEDQKRLYAELELPIAALVYSGGKSIHAIVKVDASDYDEYRDRVEYLYSYLKNHGLDIDKQNKNPSRLSRMPGVTRNGIYQALLGVNLGRKSWDDWIDFTEGEGDELPAIESWDKITEEGLPDLPPELIEGIVRRGHKLLLSSSSKAGKSFLLMELCWAIAEGRKWLKYQCAMGKVLYVNLEIDPASCKHRFKDILDALGWTPHHADNLHIWNLRGNAKPLNELVPQLARRIKKKNYAAVVIDPVYKVITGDENNASEMGRFCNQLDRICKETGATAIYCHHHSKGAQGSKKAMDRASGSGVFARDPDAQLDVIELAVSANKKEQIAEDVRDTAFRMESSLREFRNIDPLDFWFHYPIHKVDETGELEKCHPLGSPEANLEKSSKRTSEDARLTSLMDAWTFLDGHDPTTDELPTVKSMSKYLGKSERTIRRNLEEFSDIFTIQGGTVRMKDTADLE